VKRSLFLLALALLLAAPLAASAATAAHPAEPAAGLPLFTSEPACEAAATAAPRQTADALDPLHGAQARVSCPAVFCSDDYDCQQACPSDPTAYCSGFQCVYAGSGSSGGGGPSCNAFCTDTADCENACPNLTVYCSGYTCQVY
jgi:hypothetical protein